MEQCLGCLRILFGGKYHKQGSRHLVEYNDDEEMQLGIEFENLVLGDNDKLDYGTDMCEGERKISSKHQYHRIKQQKMNFDQVIENQEEAAQPMHSASLSNNRKSPTLEEVEDDFEQFLEEVRSRSDAFHNQRTGNSENETCLDIPLSLDRGIDGMSSEDELATFETTSSSLSHKTIAGCNDLTWKDDAEKLRLGGERLEPIGVGSNYVDHSMDQKKLLSSISHYGTGKLTEAERIFSIADDEDMGDFVSA